MGEIIPKTEGFGMHRLGKMNLRQEMIETAL
jgi:hypothetical protein